MEATFTFRIRPARADNTTMVAAILNALLASATVVVVGSMADDAYNALTAQFGSEDGTTVLRFDTDASKIQSAVKYRAKQLKRRQAFAPIEVHNGSDWETVAYAVRELPNN